MGFTSRSPLRSDFAIGSSTQMKNVNFKEVVGSVGERLGAVGRWFLKDPLNTLLLFASIALTVTFFALLGEIQPSSPGEKVTLSRVYELTQTKQIESATLLDQDSRVVIETANGRTVWAAYPSSDAQLNGMIN